MAAYSLELTIHARELAAKAFLALKRFDGTVVMGTALQQMREGKPFDVLLDRPDREAVLVRLIALLDELDRLGVSPQMSANNVPRSSHLWEPITWTPADASAELESLRQDARTREDEKRRGEEWLKSPKGQEYAAATARLDRIRDLVRSRWDSLGVENLLRSEQDYVYVWWLYVEVMNGRFDQYFFNSSGDSALLALSALRSLGADVAHGILSEALRQFESVGGYKTDREQRWACLGALPDGAFDDATRRFYDLPEDVRALALTEVGRDYERDGVTP